MKNKIKDLTIGEYYLLLNSGLFFELYPEATGIYEEDVKLSKKGRFKIEWDETYKDN